VRFNRIACLCRYTPELLTCGFVDINSYK